MSEPSGANTTDADTAPRALFGPLFWAMLALAVLCIAAGGLIGFAGARLFPVPTHPAPSRRLEPGHLEPGHLKLQGLAISSPAAIDRASPGPPPRRFSSAGRAPHS